MLWCSAEGTPPINISLQRDSEVLAHGKWIAVANADKEGNYKCVATNKVGFDSKNIAVTFLQGMSWVELKSNIIQRYVMFLSSSITSFHQICQVLRSHSFAALTCSICDTSKIRA